MLITDREHRYLIMSAVAMWILIWVLIFAFCPWH
jgi:hypothetical protein